MDRLSRVTAQRQLQRWMDEPLVLECNACGCEGEADNGEICSEELCIICCCRLGCECRVQPARCRSSDEAAGGEDDEEWMQTGGAEAMGLARSKDDDRAVAYMKGNRLKEELQDGKGGNCCFRSLAAEAGWGEERHKEMREAAAEKMREEGMATDAGCDLMRQLGTWGNTKAIKAVSMIIGMEVTVAVMHPREGEPAMQTVGRTDDRTKKARRMTIVFRDEHFNSAGGGMYRGMTLDGRTYGLRKVGEQWRVDGWRSNETETQTQRLVGSVKGVVTGLTEGARYHAENVWQHMGGGEKTELKPGEKIWQKADREDKVYMAVIMIMAMLMMGLAAAAGVWMSAATTMAITGFISVK